MTYSISCQCGNAIEVTATQAGADVVCHCGRSVSVPRLSELRRMAGQEAYESGVIDTINRMVREGELPWGNACAISGMTTMDSYGLYVQCENAWFKGPGKGRKWFVILMVLFAPCWIFWALLGYALLDEPRRRLGRDRGVNVPLLVRNEFHDQLRRTRSQSKLRKMLCTVPIYARLFEEFPKAKIRM